MHDFLLAGVRSSSIPGPPPSPFAVDDSHPCSITLPQRSVCTSTTTSAKNRHDGVFDETNNTFPGRGLAIGSGRGVRPRVRAGRNDRAAGRKQQRQERWFLRGRFELLRGTRCLRRRRDGPPVGQRGRLLRKTQVQFLRRKGCHEEGGPRRRRLVRGLHGPERWKLQVDHRRERAAETRQPHEEHERRETPRLLGTEGRRQGVGRVRRAEERGAVPLRSPSGRSKRGTTEEPPTIHSSRTTGWRNERRNCLRSDKRATEPSRGVRGTVRSLWLGPTTPPLLLLLCKLKLNSYTYINHVPVRTVSSPLL
mmetsp:Transcript_3086/g.6841  ORF Transcript_3086/g.6841 Transcript_3086/m.6841 type:complete len:308 (+) Transcript_3086:114-1037(+)